MITPGNTVRISADETTNCTVDGKITEISVNGNKIMAIHEMAQRLHRLMVAFTCMCIVALLMFGTILYIVLTSHPSMDQIEGVIKNSNQDLKLTKTMATRIRQLHGFFEADQSSVNKPKPEALRQLGL